MPFHALMLPHPPLIVPQVGRGSEKQVQKTIDAYRQAAAFLAEKAPDSLKGTISGAYYLFWGMGYFLGPIMWGVCGAFWGMEKSFFAFSAFLLMTAAAICLIRRKYSPAKAT